MLKKIFAALIAAQLVIVPVQAETKPPVHCTKSVIGIDDVIMFGIAFTLIMNGLAAWGRSVKRHEEKLKAEQQKPDQPAPDCKL